MSDATDRLMKARARIENARSQAHEFANAFREFEYKLRDWAIRVEETAVPIPDFTRSPTQERLRAFAAEVESALEEELDSDQTPGKEQPLKKY